ncbi:alkanesulfonate monooxygenase SsuD/methylene tetrahydromethanopterin reductase-like flavin-dependent oxidoreductase (luciferase family) [Pseudoclavibacter sp. JAI123]|uniref:LLM class flavin-dependent oxidoreductase n=1 Tax=Pseudoclavibacter sp. JAI123 TaxID=2723065 RepID=UPI0015CEEE04|nr:LLM class flavin-dependent oxidoreductase [Pseudoclavibacter sp. JAI123]NYF12639.1 alkanesulfonate monooxygenase SsuD/methylene tetrahydromethanopterin reductase-like flavin-dependent oxidoreductase (luciferase family) [Pseudoclavibacter sp. JAI123]
MPSKTPTGLALTAAELANILSTPARERLPLDVDLVLITAPRLGDPHAALGTAQLAGAFVARFPGTTVVPEIDLGIAEPFAIARETASLDILSDGRAGVAFVARETPEDLRAHGIPYLEDVHSPGYLDETIAVLHALWSSWKPDAIVRDAKTDRFVDADRVHPIHFSGAHLSIDGPSATPASPQGRPPIIVGDGKTREVVHGDGTRTTLLIHTPQSPLLDEVALRASAAQLEEEQA